MIAQLSADYIKTRPLKTLTRLVSYTFFEGRPLTTKGRWFNPVVFSILKSISTSNRRFFPIQKPIFILGTGRSGTTILGIVLSMHKDVGYLNEPKAIWHVIHPDEDIIGSYSSGNAKYRLYAKDMTVEMRQRALQMFGAFLSATGTKRIVDKYPELIFRVDYVRALFPDARFIFLVRNGWDTCTSIATWSDRNGIQLKGETHDWWGVNSRKWNLLVNQLVSTDNDLTDIVEDIKNTNCHIDRAIVEWVVTMREGLSLIETKSEYIHTVRFEELTSEPKEILSSLCNFCELPMDKTFFEYARHTLHSVPPREHFDMHPKLAPFFYDTMTRLGYNT